VIRNKGELVGVLVGAFVWFFLAVLWFYLSGLSSLKSGPWAFVIVGALVPYSLFMAGPPALLACAGFLFRHIGITAAFVIVALIFQIWAWPPDPTCLGVRGCEDPFQSYRHFVIVCWCVASVLGVVRIVRVYNEDPFRLAFQAHYQTLDRGDEEGQYPDDEEEMSLDVPPTQVRRAAVRKERGID
jgi:hypothetical protein